MASRISATVLIVQILHDSETLRKARSTSACSPISPSSPPHHENPRAGDPQHALCHDRDRRRNRLRRSTIKEGHARRVRRIIFPAASIGKSAFRNKSTYVRHDRGAKTMFDLLPTALILNSNVYDQETDQT